MSDLAGTVDLFRDLVLHWEEATENGPITFGDVEDLTPKIIISCDIGRILMASDGGRPTGKSLAWFQQFLYEFGQIPEDAEAQDILLLLTPARDNVQISLPVTVRILEEDSRTASRQLHKEAATCFFLLMTDLILTSADGGSVARLRTMSDYSSMFSSYIRAGNETTRSKCTECETAYETLELASGASLDEVKAAQRELAKSFHPDVWRERRGARGAEEQLKLINAAASHLLQCQSKAKPDIGTDAPQDVTNLYVQEDIQIPITGFNLTAVESKSKSGAWFLAVIVIGSVLSCYFWLQNRKPTSSSGTSTGIGTSAQTTALEAENDNAPRFQGLFAFSKALKTVFGNYDPGGKASLTTLNEKNASVVPLLAIPIKAGSIPLRMLVTATSIKDEDCHACGAHVGMYLFELRSGYWVLTKSQPDAFTQGAFGKPGAASLLPSNAGITGFSLRTTDMHQGYGEEFLTIVRANSDAIRPVLQLQTEDDNEGDCQNGPEVNDSLPPCYKNSASLRYEARPHSLPDLLVTHTGTEADKTQPQGIRPLNRVEHFTFSNGEYKQAVDEDEPASTPS